MSRKKSKPRIAPESLNLPCVGVDAHAHIDFKDFGDDIEDVLLNAKKAGLSHIINVFLSSEKYRMGVGIFENHKNIYYTLGIHPCDAQLCTQDELLAIKNIFISEPRLKAVGEIGLDYYWDKCPKDVQKKTFIAQLKLAKELNKPVVIHSRDAHAATLEILKSEDFANYPLLWHCFGGDLALAEQIIANGWHVSIPGPITFPKNSELREVVKHIPLDRLMIETDCPYLSPTEWRGLRNEPAYSVFTAQCVAQEKNMQTSELWQICGDNARRFFDLNP